MGELPKAIADGMQEALMASIMSANIACGGHAGDEYTMETTIRQAAKHGLTVGGHPGYPDRANFGRRELNLPPAEIAEFVYRQIAEFGRIAERCGARVAHVKPHGALYNQAAKSVPIARAIADGVGRWSRDVVMVGLAGSPMLTVFQESGFPVAAEGYADRLYEANGTLRNRQHPDALIQDPDVAAEQALGIVTRKSVVAADGTVVGVDALTICVHGDTPGAQRIAVAVAAKLRGAGVQLRGLTAR